MIKMGTLMRRFGVVQYLRPEIPGFVLGSFIAAYAFGEFRARGGSSPLVRFLLGAFFMIEAPVFLDARKGSIEVNYGIS